MKSVANLFRNSESDKKLNVTKVSRPEYSMPLNNREYFINL